MKWRSLGLVRAAFGAGLLFLLGTLFATARAAEPAPPPDSPALPATESLSILQAQAQGLITVDARGAGQDRVRVMLTNRSPKRLNVVLPPGLVASSATGQGFQSMGLGGVTARLGAFGGFQPTGEVANPGLQSVGTGRQAAAAELLGVSPGQTLDLTIPAVCLNYGKPTPTARDQFRLMLVEDYTSDPRVAKGLRALQTIGTSQGVAQAVMWNLCNGLTFDRMLSEAAKVVNSSEVALAKRFVDLLEKSQDFDSSSLLENRLFVKVVGEGSTSKDAARLTQQLAGLNILGLPVQVVSTNENPSAEALSLYLVITLRSNAAGETRGQIRVGSTAQGKNWSGIGLTPLSLDGELSTLDPADFARSIDRAVASAFVTTKVVKRASDRTIVRIENRLPMTIARAVIKTGSDKEAGRLTLDRVGLGPRQSTTETIQAADCNVERIELNGL